jgi:hypothetical protein
MRLPSDMRKRGTYVGGRDAAAIVGADAYASAGDVYAKIVHGWAPERNLRMLRGLILEPGLIDFAADYRGTRITRDVFFVDDDADHRRCSVDGVEGDLDAPDVLHETKTTRSDSIAIEMERWGPTDSDDIDPAAAAQVQWEMGITGARETHVWLYVVDADEEPRHYVIKRDRERIGMLREACDRFWRDNVLAKKPPREAPKDRDAARAMFPTHVPELIVEPTTETVQAALEFAAARQMRDAALAVMDRAGGALRAAMGRAEAMRWKKWGPIPGGAVYWKARQLDAATNWEQVAHELALRFGIPGPVFFGLQQEHTRRPWSDRSLRVFISSPSKKESK